MARTVTQAAATALTAAAKAALVDKTVDRLTGRETIGSLTDKLYENREDKRELSAKIAKLDADFEETKSKLEAKLEAEGTTKGGGKLATCSISTTVVPNVTDWDKVHAYIKKTGHYHLYMKSLSAPACRELFETKGSIPGVEPFPKKSLSIRVIPTTA